MSKLPDHCIVRREAMYPFGEHRILLFTRKAIAWRLIGRKKMGCLFKHHSTHAVTARPLQSTLVGAWHSFSLDVLPLSLPFARVFRRRAWLVPDASFDRLDVPGPFVPIHPWLSPPFDSSDRTDDETGLGKQRGPQIEIPGSTVRTETIEGRGVFPRGGRPSQSTLPLRICMSFGVGGWGLSGWVRYPDDEIRL